MCYLALLQVCLIRAVLVSEGVPSVCLSAQTFPDPVSGAAASFIQRMSEISYLEGETVRQEKIKKLKKSRKLES